MITDPALCSPWDKEQNGPQILCFSPKPETMKTNGGQTFQLGPALITYHSICHLLPQKRNTPVILGSESPCPPPWPWHKMAWNREIPWPCPHHTRLLSLMATVKNQPCPWLKLLFLSTFSNMNDLTDNILSSAQEETLSISKS